MDAGEVEQRRLSQVSHVNVPEKRISPSVEEEPLKDIYLVPMGAANTGGTLRKIKEERRTDATENMVGFPND